MKWFIICLTIGLTQIALGNAKLVRPHANAIMVSEEVEVSILGDTAQVRGYYKFQIIYDNDPKAPDGKVLFPLILEKGAQPTMEDLEFTLKVNGQKAHSYSLLAKSPLDLPVSGEYSVVWVSAGIPGKRFDQFWHVRVAYEQKLLDGVFYYLPVLNNADPRPEGFEIRVKADQPIRSVGQGAGGFIQRRANEMTFIPAHLSMIAVSTRPEPKK